MVGGCRMIRVGAHRGRSARRQLPTSANFTSAGNASNPPDGLFANSTNAARGVLKFPLLQLSVPEIEAVSVAFAEVIRTRNYTLLCLRDPVGPRPFIDPQTPRSGRNNDRAVSRRQSRERAKPSTANAKPSSMGWSRLEGVPRNLRRYRAYSGLYPQESRRRQTGRPVLVVREALQRLVARPGADRSTSRKFHAKSGLS